jgi:hypothetical protein
MPTLKTTDTGSLAPSRQNGGRCRYISCLAISAQSKPNLDSKSFSSGPSSLFSAPATLLYPTHAPTLTMNS